MSRRERKSKNKLNIKLLTISVIVIIFVICFIYNIIALFVNPTDTFMIENGKISDTKETVGYLIRDEKLFQGDNYKNGISQIKTEGQRVAKGDPIFRYYTNNEQSLTEKIANLDLQIQDALEQNEKSIYSSDIAVIDSQIEDRLTKITQLTKVNDINEYKKEINASLTKKAKLTGELSSSGSYIKELINQRSKLEEQLNSGSEYIEATVSGLVSYKVDGLEETLTPNNLENITEEYLKSLKIKTGEMIPSSNESGKIVNNYNCYLVTILEPEEVQKAEINKSVQLVLSTGDEVKAKIHNIKEQESGNSLVTFEITNCVEKLTNYRKISFSIVWWSANGLRVPNSSIVERDGENYIIRKRVGYSDDILIKVLKKSENYSIIENYTTSELKELGYTTEEIKNMKSISLYDEILLKPSK